MYKAFISYSHAADDRLAPALQSALHRFAKPWYRLRALRLFRDKTSLSATPGLWPLIQQALDESEYFVLLASPDAAASHWVGREIEHWRASKPAERVLIVLTDGELAWDDEGGDFDREASTALPGALAGAFGQEPLWVDLRWARKSEHLSLGQASFRDAIAELAATLHGRPKDEIAGEDVRQHRRARRIAWGAAIALFLLAVGLGIAGWIAVGQRNRAEERGAIALSRQLAAQALSLAGGERGDLALLLSLEALRIWPTVDARNGLLTALTRDERRLFHLHGHMGEVQGLAFGNDGKELHSLGCEGVSSLGLCAHFGVRRWDPHSGEPLAGEWDPVTGDALGRPSLAGRWSPQRDLVVELTRESLILRRVEDGRQLGRAIERKGRRVSSVALSPDGRWLVIAFSVGDEGGELELWDPGEWRLVAILAGKSPIAISPDSRLLAAAGAGGSVILRDLARRRPLGRSLEEPGDPQSVAFFDGGRQLVAGGRDSTLRVWDVETATLQYEPISTGEGSLEALAAHPDGRRLATGSSDAGVRIWEMESRPPTLVRELNGHESTVRALDFSADGELLASGSFDDTLRLWDARSGEQLGAAVETGEDVYEVAFDRSADRVAAATESGSVLLWEVTGGAKRGRVVGAHLLSSDGMTGLAFGPQGGFLISSSLEQIQAWGLAPGEPAVRPPVAGSFTVLHPAGELAALVTDSGEIQLLDVARWRPFDATLGEHDNLISDMAFSPDGRLLAAAAEDDLVLWDVDLESWRARACAMARRNLSKVEWESYLSDRPFEASCPNAPEPPAFPLDGSRALGLAVRAAKLGEAAEARRLFGAAARLGTAGDDADLMNDICWSGAQRGAFGEVLAACERAVELEPDNAGFRDSRGLARALAGDAAGAIEDFRAYVAASAENGRLAERAARRRAWIEALEAGDDPFDAMELHWVHGEGGFR